MLDTCTYKYLYPQERNNLLNNMCLQLTKRLLSKKDKKCSYVYLKYCIYFNIFLFCH